MAFVIADRVRETTSTTGTGTITLAGPYTGFQAFSVIGNGNTTYYAIIDATTGAWEVGIGTYTTSGNTLSRTTVLASSNADALVNFSAGVKDVICTQPAERTVLVQTGGTGLVAGAAAFTANGVPYANSTSTLTTGSGLTFDGTTLSASNISTAGSTTLSGGTANGVAYLNGSKVLTTGSALTFNGTILATTTLDATNIDVTNVRALDGTAAFSIASSTGVMSIDDTKFTLQDNADTTKKAQFELSGITTATTRTYTLPNITGSLATIGNLSQTFAGASTFSNTFTLSGTTTNISLGTSQTSGTWTAGGAAQTGTITLDQSTKAHTLNIGTGATENATTKTINIGTAGVSGSTTAITLGSAVSGATNSITVNGDPTFNSGTANGVAYLNASKVLTTGSALTFDGTTFNAPNSVITSSSSSTALRITQTGSGNALLVEDAANPDSSPFVIDQSGVVVVGNTAADSITAGNTPNLQVLSTGDNASAIFAVRYAANTGPGSLRLGKSRATSVGARSVVLANDQTGLIRFYGDDGTNFIESAQIQAAVDGTPGTNDMPGRLVFSTTADGSSTPTERMRIDSAGNVGIGSTPVVWARQTIGGTLPSSSGLSAHYDAAGTVPSTSTTQADGFLSRYTTAAASFTLGAMTHFRASQGTLGAGSSVTSQYGFTASFNLTGATNNFGFYSDIPSGTGRWNFYANGTASNFFGGNTIISVNDNTNAALRITQTGSGNALLVEDAANPDSTPFVIANDGRTVIGASSAYGISGLTQPMLTVSEAEGQIGVATWNGSAPGFNAGIQLMRSRSGTVGTYTAVQSGDTIGAIRFAGADGAAFVRAAEITATIDGTPGTNDMPGRLVFSTTADGASSPTERMRIDNAGNLGLGVTPSAWGNTYRMQQIGVNTAVGGRTTASQAYLAANWYHDGTNNRYITSAAATQYQQDAGAHYWFTAPSGTAGNAISFTQAMTLDASGNLGVGTTSPSSKLDVQLSSATAYSSGVTGNGLRIYNSSATTGQYVGISFYGEPTTGNGGVATIMGTTTGSGNMDLVFSTRGSSTLAERARITSGGDYVVGSSSTVGSAGRIQAVQASSTGNACISADAQSSSYAYNIAYLNTNTAAGTGFYFISCTTGGYGTYQFRFRGDGTIYAQNTTVQSLSDVRVKENIRDSEDGLQVVLGLQPRRFDFKQGFGNDRKNVLGFIAQEIEVVFPDAVDITPVDPDGEGPEEPYKSVGPGALIPVLVKAIQELNAKVEAQAAEIAALKSK